MLEILRVLFLPDEKNNQKAKILHSSFLSFFIICVALFQSLLWLLVRVKPGVLGYASNINSEDLLKFTNKKRREYNLPTLKTNPLLEEAARQKATAMFSFGCWSHNCNGQTPWDFFRKVGYDYLFAGENLARDFAQSYDVIEAWMESPTHRENLLNEKYEEIGFAVVDGILNGEETTLVVQLFGTPVKNKASLGSASQIAFSPKENEEEIIVSEKEAEILFASPLKKLKTFSLSSFYLSKAFSLSLIIFLGIILFIDSFLISQKKIARISGKSFIHLSFFTIILIVILLSRQGRTL